MVGEDMQRQLDFQGVFRLTPQGDVHLRAHQGQGGAELVGRVGREPAQPLERRLQARQHAVEGGGQLAQLVSRRKVEPDAAVQVLLADLPSRGRHHAHRSQCAPREPVAQRPGSGHQDRHHRRQQDAHPEQRLLQLIDGPAEDERARGPAGQVDRDREDPYRLPAQHHRLAATAARMGRLLGARGSEPGGVVDLPRAAENLAIRGEQQRADRDPGVGLARQRLGAIGSLLAGVLQDLRLDQVALRDQARVHRLVLHGSEGQPEPQRRHHRHQRKGAEVDEGQSDSGPAELLAHPGVGSNL